MAKISTITTLKDIENNDGIKINKIIARYKAKCKSLSTERIDLLETEKALTNIIMEQQNKNVEEISEKEKLKLTIERLKEENKILKDKSITGIPSIDKLEAEFKQEEEEEALALKKISQNLEAKTEYFKKKFNIV